MEFRMAMADDYEALYRGYDAFLAEMEQFQPADANPPGLQREWIEKALAGDDCALLMAVDGDKLAGFVRGSLLPPDPDEPLHTNVAKLNDLWLAEDCRGQGVGRTLVQRAIAWARERGAQSLTLNVYANNPRARRLYQSEGFEEFRIQMIKKL